jgi:hypothetical protein
MYSSRMVNYWHMINDRCLILALSLSDTYMSNIEHVLHEWNALECAYIGTLIDMERRTIYCYENIVDVSLINLFPNTDTPQKQTKSY